MHQPLLCQCHYVSQVHHDCSRRLSFLFHQQYHLILYPCGKKIDLFFSVSQQGLIEPLKAARGHATHIDGEIQHVTNLNLRDVLLRGPRRAHHDNPSLLAVVLDV